MGRKVTHNVNHGGVVGIQAAHRTHDKDSKNDQGSKGNKGRGKDNDKGNAPDTSTKKRDSQVTNVNHGTVGEQGGTITGRTIAINGKKR